MPDTKPTFTLTEDLVCIVIRDDEGKNDDLIRNLLLPGPLEPVYFHNYRRTYDGTTTARRVHLFFHKSQIKDVLPYLEERADKVDAHPEFKRELRKGKIEFAVLGSKDP